MTMVAQHRNKPEQAFTLVELLVVIAIIALLAALLVPVVRTSQARAREATCRANLKTIGFALVDYATAHKQRLPPYVSDGGETWDELILPGLGNSKQVFHCPEDRLVHSGQIGDHPRTYAANAGEIYLDTGAYPFGSFDGRGPLLLSQLRSRSSRVILIGERPGDSVDNRGYVGEYPFSTLDQLPGTVHRDGTGGHYLFADMGVQYLDKDEAALSDATDFWYVQ